MSFEDGRREEYLLSVPLTEEEAEALLEAAARMGQDIGAFLSGIVTDIHNGLGDEGGLINAYLERAEPADAGESFVAFCLAWGHDVGRLADLNEVIRDHAEEAAVIREDLAKGAFPADHGWMDGTAPEDAERGLAFHEDRIREAEEEKADLWRAYTRGAYPGEALTEEEALEEAAAFLREAETLKAERATSRAKAAIDAR